METVTIIFDDPKRKPGSAPHSLHRSSCQDVSRALATHPSHVATGFADEAHAREMCEDDGQEAPDNAPCMKGN